MFVQPSEEVEGLKSMHQQEREQRTGRRDERVKKVGRYYDTASVTLPDLSAMSFSTGDDGPVTTVVRLPASTASPATGMCL